ncbi:hypothetical protein HHK36_014996 [Tetracentron sinense]|uniref:Signal peptidase complex subunit 3 n=1 Tax=Tetracentron sinense TaxID=13715 RepID=A0A834Z5D4_TETSI|nr:hypothetical protein HHK36_014996 [Tetracentron sinense]
MAEREMTGDRDEGGGEEVLKVNRFRKQLSGNDEVSLTLNISMDVQSTFTWNTKQVFVFVAAEYQTAQNSLNQVSLWDHIIQDKDQANLQTQIVTKYPLIDQGSNLRGTKIKLVLHWYIMPKTGGIIEDKMVNELLNIWTDLLDEPSGDQNHLWAMAHGRMLAALLLMYSLYEWTQRSISNDMSSP